MPRRPGAIGLGYLPKGGAKVALEMAAEAERKRTADAVGDLDPRAADLARVLGLDPSSLAGVGAASVGGAGSLPGLRPWSSRSGARSRAGRLATVGGLAVIGAVSGVGSALGLLLHLTVG